MKGRKRLNVEIVLAAVFAVACGSATPLAATTATPSSGEEVTSSSAVTAQASPTGPASASPGAIVDSTFGFLIGNAVHRESDAQTVFILGIGNFAGVVSHDGRRLAYWDKASLRVIDIAPGSTPRTLMNVTALGEYAYNIAWSSDGTGIAVGVNGGGGGAADAPPGYTAIRLIEVTGGQPREIARIANANVVPLAWERTAHLIAAYEPFCCGTLNYDTITEEGAVTRTKPDSDLYFFQPSHDAKFVFGRNLASGDGPFLSTTYLRVWPVGSYEAGTTIRSAKAGPIRAAEWMPGSQLIGVLFDDRLELWSPNGLSRAISLPNVPPFAAANPNASLLFRADGKAVFISVQAGTGADANTIAVEIETGTSEDVIWGGLWPQPRTSVRLS